MKTILMTLTFVATLCLATSCSSRKDDSKKEAEDQNEKKFDNSTIESDTEFAVGVADGGLLEVKLGQLAQTNAYSGEVKSLGKMMITEHSQGNNELRALAAKKDITLPGSLSNKYQGKYDDLAKKMGKDFDDAYTKAMVKGHKEVLEIFKKESISGEDAEIKAWAEDKIPTIEHHLEMARQTEKAVDRMK